jgi:hypothetical protein
MCGETAKSTWAEHGHKWAGSEHNIFITITPHGGEALTTVVIKAPFHQLIIKTI